MHQLSVSIYNPGLLKSMTRALPPNFPRPRGEASLLLYIHPSASFRTFSSARKISRASCLPNRSGRLVIVVWTFVRPCPPDFVPRAAEDPFTVCARIHTFTLLSATLAGASAQMLYKQLLQPAHDMCYATRYRPSARQP